MRRVDHLLTGIDALVTMDDGAIPRRGTDADRIGLIHDGAVAVADGRIVAVGKTGEVARDYEAPPEGRFDGTGATVLPGFIDPHTHLLFAGSREVEFEMRLAGKSYMEIAAAGGGILSSVWAFRAAGDEDLCAQSNARLDGMLRRGTTTAEVKSGYGLSVEHEVRALRLIDRLDARHPVDLLGTFLGAHDVAPEYRDRPDAYVALVCEEMIPRVAAETRARFCDVFCEKGVFTSEQARTILVTGMHHGLRPRLHADEFADSGASALAAELHALSADHLMAASEQGLAALASAPTVAILLPGTTFSLGQRAYAPVGRLRERGIPMALATDCNPGSSMTTNLPWIVSLAVLQMGMSLGEALTAVTVHAALSLGIESEVGRISPGMRADLQVLPSRSPAGIVYHLGDLPPRGVMKAGKWVVGPEGRPT